MKSGLKLVIKMRYSFDMLGLLKDVHGELLGLLRQYVYLNS